MIIHGRDAQLLLQPETTYRTAPGAADAVQMKFNTLDYGREPVYNEDPTIKSQPLMDRRDVIDAALAGRLEAIACLRDIGHWLALLWGAPVTTGSGPYTHTFTLNLADRPSALLELGFLSATRYRRWLGCMVNQISWDILGDDQNIEVELLGAVEVDPAPGSVWDASPTVHTKARAARRTAAVYDVQGSSTLGKIAECSLQLGNDLDPRILADGQEGPGLVLLGQPTVEGTATVLVEDSTTLLDHARAQTSKPMTITTESLDGAHSLTVNLPAVEFTEAKDRIQTSRGLVVETTWRAHADVTPPSIVLVNDVEAYG